MKYSILPNSEIEVSKICLGTMTWGQQNNEEEAFAQMDYALEKGVNFFDTAELYSVPARAETQGSTERIIGNWFQKRGNRSEIILASKASGPGPKHIRQGPNFSKSHLEEALHQSLSRLQTDYLDLYQLHWPERHSPRFGELNYEHKEEVEYEDFQVVLETLHGFVKQGKVRHIGISNETPWGSMKWIQTAEQNDLPPISTIQNPYSLLNRVFEIGNSEVCLRENMGLLAYSPLGGGLLSGKYRNGTKPENSRYALYPNYFGRYAHPNTIKATNAYVDLALENGISPTQMALAFVNTRNFLTSNIIGATTIDQLKENIASIEIELSEKILNEIDAIHFDFPNPAP